ncbi:MAG: DUF924 domain-containing protein [Candidatus Sphingomonas phytovorans]|nr:DUF924 family protein [Sphingomonas sp.]WEK01528.1 MAG: DUF924 domain-containing protein [Sphingomonas sp.]
MRGDLGAGSGEVHEKARTVLSFWFDEVPAKKRFARDEALDRQIAERFGAMRDDVLARDARGWRDDSEPLLAAIILLDQFSRNMHRDTAEAFAGDALALDLAREAIEKGWDERLDPDERRPFLYMPLMHAENREAQTLSVACFEQLGNEEHLFYALDHAEVIARFGRFPSRNAALGRQSTPAEEVYLSRPGAGW